MPNKHRFPPQKCDPNPNFRTNSIAGCKYDAKPPPFKPQTRTITDLALKPTTVIPQPTTVIPHPTTVPLRPDKKPDTVTTQTNASLNIIGLGHFVSNKQNNNDEDNNDDDPLWSKVIKEKVKATKKMNMDAYVEYHELTSVEIEAAKMTKASYINLREGPYASQAYANEHLKNWQLDTTLSDEHTSVFVSKDGKVAIAYRGTQAGRDWATNAKLALGLEESSTQMQEVEKTFQRIMQKYGKGSIEFFTGHSKGGGQAIAMGNKHKIPTITQDPALTPKMIKGAEGDVHHVINRTPTDWVSGLTPVARKLKNNFTQILIKPTKGTGILGSHDVNLMTAFDYVPKYGQGDTDYNPRVKDKAYVSKLLKSGMTLSDIIDSIGHDNPTLIDDYNDVIANTNKDFMKSAGYSTSASNQFTDTIVKTATSHVETATSHAATNANKLVNRSTGANVAASVAAAAVLQNFGADDTTAAVVGGGIGNVAGEVVGKGVGINTVIGGRAISLRNAFTSGAIGGIAGNEMQTHAYNVLSNAGVDHATATIISSTAGGATQGAAEYQANVAIAYAERQYGRGVISAAVRSAIAGGIERVGLTETLGVIAGEVGGGAMDGRWGGWYGTLIGAGIGLVGGVVSVATAEQEHEIYGITPSIFEGPDRAVGTDSEILRIMREFNESRNFSDESIQQVQAQLDARVQAMKDNGILGMVLPPLQILKVPEHTIDQNSNVMLEGTYSAAALEEYLDQLQAGPSREEIARIQAMPTHSALSHIITLFTADTEYQSLINSEQQDLHAINLRIRQIIAEQGDCTTGSCQEDFYAILHGVGDFPQLSKDGNWITQSIHDPIPTEPTDTQDTTDTKGTTDTQDDQVWHDEPPPNTANEHTPIEPDTDNFSEAMERGIIP